MYRDHARPGTSRSATSMRRTFPRQRSPWPGRMRHDYGAEPDSFHGRCVISPTCRAPFDLIVTNPPYVARQGPARPRTGSQGSRTGVWHCSAATTGSTQSRRLSNSAVARLLPTVISSWKSATARRSGCRNRRSVPDLVLEEIRADQQGIPRVAVLRRA